MDSERTRRERDLYRRLLELGSQDRLEPFLKEALGLIVDMTGAQRGYLELRDLARHRDAVWWMAHECSDSEIDDIQSTISRGIIAEALATGRTVVTSSALIDERFQERESVQARKIEAVICAPVGGGAGLGAVYLEGRHDAGPFSSEDSRIAEIFALHLAPLADRLLVRSRVDEAGDATRELRDRNRLDGIVGQSAALAAALREAMLAAPLDVNVLLTGESGTGKSQLAQAIHENSPRAGGPFVELNCAALPQNLIESELFGARAGSYTGANRDTPGKVAAAEGGTLFLDEIGELPLEAQGKLLQLLQSRRYFPLGSNEPVKADVRLLAATNAELEELVAARRFRDDLYFRLQVLLVRLPTLAERRSDLRELSEAICRRVCMEHSLPPVALSSGALQAIEEAEWPGNVRQLENVLTRAVVRAGAEAAPAVTAQHVFPNRWPEEAGVDAARLTYQEATQRFQRDLLARVLLEADWNVAEAARRLDLSRAHLYNLIHAFELKRAK